MILPVKKHLIDLERTKNPAKSRLGYLRLDKNENTIGFSQEFIDILKKEVNSDFLTAYPEIGSFYQKIAGWLGCAQENIYITAGSDAGIKAVFEVFVEEGNNVVLCNPTYAMFYVYTKMFQGNLIAINYKEDLSLSAEDVIKVIYEHKPKLICIANPNSPTGTILPPDGINKIIDVALQQNSIVLLDEAYYPFYQVSSVGLIFKYPNLVITRTCSKAMGLASARLGFVVGQPQIIEYLYKVRPMYETNAFAVRFAELILDNYHLVEKNLEEVKKAKEYLQEELNRFQIPYFKSYANFILINVGSFEISTQLGEALYHRKILVKAGFKDGVLKNCIRVTIGNVEQMRFFMENFKEVFESIR